jgi:hypothetical protein
MVEVVIAPGDGGSESVSRQPFGVLHPAAVKMYVEGGYCDLFQLEFKHIRHFFKDISTETED